MSFQTRKILIYFRNTYQDIFGWNPRAFLPCINSNATTTFKTQKGSKYIVKGLLHPKMKIVS